MKWYPPTDHSHGNNNVLCYNPISRKMRVARIKNDNKSVYWARLPQPPIQPRITKYWERFEKRKEIANRQLAAVTLYEEGENTNRNCKTTELCPHHSPCKNKTWTLALENRPLSNSDRVFRLYGIRIYQLLSIDLHTKSRITRRTAKRPEPASLSKNN